MGNLGRLVTIRAYIIIELILVASMIVLGVHISHVQGLPKLVYAIVQAAFGSSAIVIFMFKILGLRQTEAAFVALAVGAPILYFMALRCGV